MATGSEERRSSRAEGLSRLLTVLLTNATKIAGLYVGVRAAVAPTPNAVVLAFSAFLIAGGQLSEGALLGVIERFFAVSQQGKSPPKGGG